MAVTAAYASMYSCGDGSGLLLHIVSGGGLGLHVIGDSNSCLYVSGIGGGNDLYL